MKKLITARAVALTFCVGIVAIAGCASIGNFLNQNSLAAQLVVQEATARVIEAGGSAADKQARAQKIAIITAQVKQVIDTTAMDLPSIVAFVGQQVLAIKLGPADAILAQGLIDVLTQEIAAKVCPGSTVPASTTAPPSATVPAACTIPATFTATADTVLSWVTSTTALYTPKA